jgi:hypothetical protein
LRRIVRREDTEGLTRLTRAPFLADVSRGCGSVNNSDYATHPAISNTDNKDKKIFFFCFALGLKSQTGATNFCSLRHSQLRISNGFGLHCACTQATARDGVEVRELSCQARGVVIDIGIVLLESHIKVSVCPILHQAGRKFFMCPPRSLISFSSSALLPNSYVCHPSSKNLQESRSQYRISCTVLIRPCWHLLLYPLYICGLVDRFRIFSSLLSLYYRFIKFIACPDVLVLENFV